MKPLIKSILIALLVAQVVAETILYDGFDYPQTVSLNNLGYTEFSWETNRWHKIGGHFTDWLVATNSLPYPSLPSTGHHITQPLSEGGSAEYRRYFAPHFLAHADSLWFSFLIRITHRTGWTLYFYGWETGRFGVRGRWYDYNLYAALATCPDEYSPNSIFLGSNITHLIVGRYQLSETNAQLDVWIDPDVSSEPQTGGPSSSNHIVHTSSCVTLPDRIDWLELSALPLGSLEFDELRVGTTWNEVVSRCVDRVSIASIAMSSGIVSLNLERLTPAVATTVEIGADLLSTGEWNATDTFVPQTRSTNRMMTIPFGSTIFYRITAE